MDKEQCHFSGYATRNDLLCGDGRTIRKNAFKDCDGATVPLVYNHQHNDPNAVLGHALLENREDGVYAYCQFNDTPQGKTGKELVEHGDVRSLSIYANQLKQIGSDVVHGVIRELSLVLAGANPGAYIDFVMAHGEDGEDSLYANYDENALTLYHSDDSKESKKTEEAKMAEEKKTEETKSGEPKSEKTVQEVLDTMNEEQLEACYYLVGKAMEADETEKTDSKEGEGKEMKQNVFAQDNVTKTDVLTHADQEMILSMAKETGIGSLQKAIELFAKDHESLAHGLDLGDTEVLEELIPDHKLLNPGAPEIIKDFDDSWVMGVINKIHKSPYARIRTRKADARQAELKAKGYKKGEEKQYTNHIKLLGRKTEPTTIYLKDQLNRDDIIDITDFDVVAYVWNMMKDNMYETLALCALVGDGREDTDPDKISEENIRPIWKDEDFYTIHQDVDIAKAKEELQGTNTGANFGENYIYAEAMITAALYSREKFKGSGTPTLYCAPHLVNVMLLARDLNGRRIYDSKADLARALNVSGIVEIEQLEGKTRKTADGKTKKLLGLFVNLADYQFGSTKGGEITKFSDFDIDFNKYKYLMETRLSGALTEPFSAIALEEPVVDAED
jgi:hypothetical protein